MNDRRRELAPFAYEPQEPLDPDPWALDEELADGGSSANPALDDYDAQSRESWGPGYSGAGHYSSGDFDPDLETDYDYDYAGFKGDAGFEEIGDQQYGGGRYAPGPFESSDEFGAGDFRRERGGFGELQREFDARSLRQWRHPQDELRSLGRPRPERGVPFASGWNDARDWADPAGFRTFRPRPALMMPRGPKNYRRSDERILEDVYLRLLRDPSIDSSDVSVEVHRGVATLVGSVPTRHMKHEIEEAIHAIPGIAEIHNRVKVNSGPAAPA